MATTKAWCSRCKIARACHSTTGSACNNYIDPESDAGRAMARAEAATKVQSAPIDRVLLAEVIENFEALLTDAKRATVACLAAAKAGAPRTASRYAERALKALGGLGAA